MARIRTVKPEFWEDETIAALSRDARLLFIATFNMADDEGLLRWTPEYVKANAFIYDADIDGEACARLMAELSNAGLVFPYVGGQVRQVLAYVVNFRKHQKINRPQPSKLPAPSLQNPQVRTMYAKRDGWICHLCHEPIDPAETNTKRALAIDHLQPQSAGGSDHPSNVRAAHSSCNKARRDRGVPDAVLSDVIDSVNDSVNPARPLPEPFTPGRGRGMEGEQGGDARGAEPPSRCRQHAGSADDPPCRACGTARRAHDSWVRAQKSKPTPVPGPGDEPHCPVPEHETELARNCRMCASERKAAS